MKLEVERRLNARQNESQKLKNLNEAHRRFGKVYVSGTAVQELVKDVRTAEKKQVLECGMAVMERKY